MASSSKNTTGKMSEVCAHGNGCQEKVLPHSEFCEQHVMHDQLEPIYRYCGAAPFKVPCTLPVLNRGEDSTCELHMKFFGGPQYPKLPVVLDPIEEWHFTKHRADRSNPPPAKKKKIDEKPVEEYFSSEKDDGEKEDPYSDDDEWTI